MNPLAAKKSFSREQLNIIRTMLRIDLAGEIAANRIYQGQKHAFRGDSSTLNLIDAMHEQERRHLAQLRQLCRVYNVTPSKATPLAHGLSYVVGLASGWLGKDAAMAVTSAVETVVGEHYNSQLRELLTIAPPETTKELRAAIRKMRDEELEHLCTAEEHQTHGSSIPVTTLSNLVRIGCRAAIALVSRV